MSAKLLAEVVLVAVAVSALTSYLTGFIGAWLADRRRSALIQRFDHALAGLPYDEPREPRP
jgi:uncharacterized membrane protein YfcA